MEKVQVIPAVIPQSYDDLSSALASLRGVSSTAHIDVCDGRFVPSVSWPVSGDAGEWAETVSQDRGLPFWEDFEFEFDLMVGNPLALALEAIEAGAARAVLHLEAAGFAEAFEALLVDGRAEIWVAGGARLNLEKHLATIGRAAGYQQMGIAKIGYQGQPFEPAALENVRVVRGAFPDLPIAFDGAVSEVTAGAIFSAGASRLVAGSAVALAENPAAAARSIRAAAAAATA